MKLMKEEQDRKDQQVINNEFTNKDVSLIWLFDIANFVNCL